MEAAIVGWLGWLSPSLSGCWAAEEDAAPVEMTPIVIKGVPDPNRQDTVDDFFRSYRRTRIDQTVIEQESLSDVTSLIDRAPGVTITPAGPLVQRPEIRGLGGERVLTVIDGVRLGNQGLTHNGGGDVNLVDPAMIDHIDVIKGSPAVLYDPGAAGGIINIHLKTLPEAERARLQARLDGDSGLGKRRWSVTAGGQLQGLGGMVTQSRETTQDYRVQDQAQLDELLRATNVRDERVGTAHEITDLGYRKRSVGGQIGYARPGWGELELQHQRYRAEDIWFTHPGSERLFFRDQSRRQQTRLGYHLDALAPVHDLDLAVYQQTVENTTHTGFGEDITELESRGARARGRLDLGAWRLTLGLEVMQDEARTQVLADQRYWAGFFQGERGWGRWLWTLGVRLNHWQATARDRPGRDPAVAEQLVGVTGAPGDSSETAPTYALGLVYQLHDAQNLTLNYSRTYRFPNLYERYAADGYFGGGTALQAEAAHNLELGWRYYRDRFSASLALFYSRFANYIGNREVRRLIDQPALEACIAAGRCDPAAGDYDDQEDAFFRTGLFFDNFDQVRNRGIEFAMAHWQARRYEVRFNTFVNDFRAADPAAEVDENPLELNLVARRLFPVGHFVPWIKTKLRYTAAWPHVADPAFEPFLLIDAYAGINYHHRETAEIRLNLGLRNLGNSEYQEPYTALPGLKRALIGGAQMALRF